MNREKAIKECEDQGLVVIENYKNTGSVLVADLKWKREYDSVDEFIKSVSKGV